MKRSSNYKNGVGHVLNIFESAADWRATRPACPLFRLYWPNHHFVRPVCDKPSIRKQRLMVCFQRTDYSYTSNMTSAPPSPNKGKTPRPCPSSYRALTYLVTRTRPNPLSATLSQHTCSLAHVSAYLFPRKYEAHVKKVTEGSPPFAVSLLELVPAQEKETPCFVLEWADVVQQCRIHWVLR
jgi:hypothetical protein